MTGTRRRRLVVTAATQSSLLLLGALKGVFDGHFWSMLPLILLGLGILSLTGTILIYLRGIQIAEGLAAASSLGFLAFTAVAGPVGLFMLSWPLVSALAFLTFSEFAIVVGWLVVILVPSSLLYLIFSRKL